MAAPLATSGATTRGRQAGRGGSFRAAEYRAAGTLSTRAANEGLTKVREDFTITEKAPTEPSPGLKCLLALSH